MQQENCDDEDIATSKETEFPKAGRGDDADDGGDRTARREPQDAMGHCTILPTSDQTVSG